MLELRRGELGVVGANDRQRARWWCQLIEALERVLEHRASTHQATVLFRDLSTESTLHVLGQSDPLATCQGKGPIHRSGIALDRLLHGHSQLLRIHWHRVDAC